MTDHWTRTTPNASRSSTGSPSASRSFGGRGLVFANAGDDLHAVGSLQPLAAAIGCIVIRSDGSRVLARVMPDPLAEQKDG